MKFFVNPGINVLQKSGTPVVKLSITLSSFHAWLFPQSPETKVFNSVLRRAFALRLCVHTAPCSI